MDPQLIEAFTMLGIGMVTVFSVLSLVFLTGKSLIAFVNFVSAEKKLANHEIAPEIIAVISATVETVTSGKGKISKIEKK